MSRNPQHDRRAANGASANGNGHAVLPAAEHPRPIIAPSGGGTSLEPRVLWNAFSRRWLLCVTVGLVLGGAAAFGVWSVVPAPYTAFAEIRVLPYDPRVPSTPIELQQSDPKTYKETQRKLIASPSVLRKALSPADESQLRKFASIDSDRLEQELRISDSGAEFIRISLSGNDPQEVADLVNAVTRAYLDEVAGREQERLLARIKQLQTLEQHTADLLQTRQAQLREFVDRFGAPDSQTLSALQRMHLEVLGRLRSELIQVQTKLELKQVQLKAFDSSRQNTPVEIPDALLGREIERDPAYRELAERIDGQKGQLSRYTAEMSPNHPNLKSIRSTLAQLEADLESKRNELREPTRQRLLDTIERTSTTTREEIEYEIAYLTHVKAEMERLVRDEEVGRERSSGGNAFDLEMLRDQVASLAAARKGYEQDIRGLEFERDQKELVEARVSLFRPAEPPQSRDNSKKIKTTGMAGLAVFGLAVGAIVLLELRTRRIGSLDEIETGLSLRIMGALPQMPRSVTSGRSRRNGRTAFWQSVLTESVDSTRTVLLRDATVEPLKAVMITSASTGEGKTTLACHLATSLARAGRNVLLADCDLRRPDIHKIFDMPGTNGVCELLRGQATVDEAVQPTPRERLWVLPAGRMDGEALAALAQEQFASILEELRGRFDFIVIDSAPILPVTDSLLISQHIDGVIVAVRRQVSRSLKVAAACQRLAMLGVPMLGAVAIGLDNESYGYRYRSGYGYSYGNGSASGNGNGARSPRPELATVGGPAGADGGPPNDAPNGSSSAGVS